MPLYRFAFAKRANQPRLKPVSLTLLQRPLLYVGDHYISFLGLIAFVALFSAGLFIARGLQSDTVRRFFARFKIETNFIAIATIILSLEELDFYTISSV